MVIGSLAENCARRHPNRAATVYEGKKQTFKQFNQRVNQLVHVFKDLGLQKGDKVAILSRNKPEVLEICFACAKSGIVYVPINFRLTGRELEFVINDAKAKVIFIDDTYMETIHSIKDNLNVLHSFSLKNEYEKLLEGKQSNEADKKVISKDDLFAIFYTSGTTGSPKGVMLTHENFLTAAINHTIAYGLSPSDVCLHVMPFYHTMECSMVVSQFYIGGTNVIIDNFDPHHFWILVNEEDISHITMVPTMLTSTIKAYKEGEYSKSSLKSISVGGQALPVELLKNAVKTLGKNLVFIVYGLTEASPLITYLPKEDVVTEGEKAKRLASVGKEFFHCEVRVVDDDGNNLPSHSIGEIIVKGPNVMKGYWNKENATNETLKNGWLYTGDIGKFDEDKYLYLIDRKKDIIISGGENISPREIEEVLYTHETVVECSVFGIPDEKWGEKLVAAIVVKEKQVSADDLINYCGERLASYKVPKTITIKHELPKDPVGKIQKRIIRDQYIQNINEMKEGLA
ncbi:acyl-CoA synthetase [Salipaludibacillus sp. CF4.18]|uniref:acyl-CoA synthetase n=1 Tax=Salipaludibacillus sp. CF4.18 TaxID=3373081 RepID=UPI003EE5F729